MENLSTRIRNALHSEGYYKITDMLDVTDRDLSRILNLGKKSIKEIRERIQEVKTQLILSHVSCVEEKVINCRTCKHYFISPSNGKSLCERKNDLCVDGKYFVADEDVVKLYISSKSLAKTNY